MEKNEKRKEYLVTAGIWAPLGVYAERKRITFALAAEAIRECSLLLYQKEKADILEIPMPVCPELGNVRSLLIEGISAADLEYNYRIDGAVVPDPRARLVRRDVPFGIRAEAEHQVRCAVPGDRFSWDGDAPLEIPYNEVIAYSAHPRGFTKHPASKVRHKGTFLGIQEKIPYLKELGINQLELMPVYDFDEFAVEEERETPYYAVPKQNRPLNYWGYVRGNYFAPNMAYAATRDPVKELKTLIKTLHQNGIEVILEFFFYPDQDVEYILNCLTYWAREYHVDGFHLSGDGSALQAVARHPYLTRRKLMADYFDTQQVYGKRGGPGYKNLAEYHEGFLIDVRRLLKGDEDQMNNFLFRMKRNPDTVGVMNFISYHNGFTLMDLVSYDVKHNEDNQENNQDGTIYNYSWNCGEEGRSRKRKVLELRKRQIKNALACVFLSQGTPLLYGGDEIGNSQAGNNNAYCQDNESGWIDWQAERRNKDIREFVKNLIAFRKRYVMLHPAGELQNIDALSCGYPDLSYHGEKAWYGAFENTSRQVGMMYCGKYADEADFLYMAYNFHWTDHDFALPKLPAGYQWCVAGSTDPEVPGGFYPAGKEPCLSDQRKAEVTARTVVILLGKEMPDEDKTDGTEKLTREEMSDKPEKTSKPDKPEKTGKSDEPEKPEKTGKSDEPEKPEKTGKSDEPEKPERTGKSDEPEKPEKTGKSDEPEKPEKTGYTDKSDNMEKK